MTEQKTSANSAISRSFDVLDVLSRQLRPVSIQELSLELGVPRQSVHRLIGQLEALGIVTREIGSERFSVGTRLKSLSLACLSSHQQTASSHAILERLVGEVGETCNVGMLDSGQVFYLDRVECDWPLRVQLRPGSRVPAHCTAIGKLLLAFSESRTRQKILANTKLSQLTDNTITDPVLLDLAFEEIRTRGFSINNEEDSVGLIALAVPIRDPSGTVVAGLGMHAPTARVSIERAKGFLPKIRAAADEIAEAMF
ncbi:IclR family transcriptional regulator [Salipiger mucosus]|uniref:Transcriptional regulator, IclR family n=1 Tax=Salipiger mucosus DSM 16094 TaxID=1123237 RepID=S9RN75_9RHOB|nr:IclR family transcriptional regulator [Salipiger mucosus]EPX75434.1 Transcriptional regulator, IclR family [Salipiger mucosus DSM 16094]